MDIHNLALQFAFLYAPFVHTPTEQITPTLSRGMDPKVKDIQVLHDKGFKTIISLRTNPQKKKEKLCDQLGMHWVWIKTGVFKVPTFEQMDQFRAVVNNPKMQPCYASCEVNMDRTGVYIAAHRMVDLHWSAQQVADEFKQHHQKTWCQHSENISLKLKRTQPREPAASPLPRHKQYQAEHFPPQPQPL